MTPGAPGPVRDPDDQADGAGSGLELGAGLAALARPPASEALIQRVLATVPQLPQTSGSADAGGTHRGRWLTGQHRVAAAAVAVVALVSALAMRVQSGLIPAPAARPTLLADARSPAAVTPRLAPSPLLPRAMALPGARRSGNPASPGPAAVPGKDRPASAAPAAPQNAPPNSGPADSGPADPDSRLQPAEPQLADEADPPGPAMAIETEPDYDTRVEPPSRPQPAHPARMGWSAEPDETR